MGGRGASSSTALARTRTQQSTLPKSGAALAALRSTGARVDGDVGPVAARVFGDSGPSAWSALTTAPAGYSVHVDRFVEEGSAVEMYGTVRTAAGGHAGEFGATFSREGGRLIAKTDNLLMAEAHQSKGAGAAVARNLEETYRRLGVSEVRLHASQVGRYVWARQGYDYSQATGQQMHAAYGSWLDRNGHDVGEAGAALRGARALAESRHGKAFLLSDDAPNWHGSKRL